MSRSVIYSKSKYCWDPMNAPERFLSWRWENEDDENRLTYQPDTRLPNAATFVLGKEDHTIGNLMRMSVFSKLFSIHTFLLIPFSCGTANY